MPFIKRYQRHEVKNELQTEKKSATDRMRGQTASVTADISDIVSSSQLTQNSLQWLAMSHTATVLRVSRQTIGLIRSCSWLSSVLSPVTAVRTVSTMALFAFITLGHLTTF